MNKRKNEKFIPYLLSEYDFKVYFSLEKKLEKYLKVLDHLFHNQQIKYSIAIIKATEESVKETKKNIRNTDIFVKVPYIQNYYIIILQNTDSKAAIQFTSRLTSLISRNFMLEKKKIQHFYSLITIENNTPKSSILAYEIMLIIKHLKEKSSKNDSWNEIKRF